MIELKPPEVEIHVKISISRIELDIEVQEVFGSSVSVRISDLVESDALVFTFSDKEDDLVEYNFAVFTASIMNLEYLLLEFQCTIYDLFQ